MQDRQLCITVNLVNAASLPLPPPHPQDGRIVIKCIRSITMETVTHFSNLETAVVGRGLHFETTDLLRFTNQMQRATQRGKMKQEHAIRTKTSQRQAMCKDKRGFSSIISQIIPQF